VDKHDFIFSIPEALQTISVVTNTNLLRSSTSGRSYIFTMAATNDWTPTC
jgi:hypothetical protein